MTCPIRLLASREGLTDMYHRWILPERQYLELSNPKCTRESHSRPHLGDCCWQYGYPGKEGSLVAPSALPTARCHSTVAVDCHRPVLPWVSPALHRPMRAISRARLPSTLQGTGPNDAPTTAFTRWPLPGHPMARNTAYP